MKPSAFHNAKQDFFVKNSLRGEGKGMEQHSLPEQLPFKPDL